MRCDSVDSEKIMEELCMFCISQLWNRFATYNELEGLLYGNVLSDSSDGRFSINDIICELKNRIWVAEKDGKYYLSPMGKIIFENRNTKLSLASLV